jgi:hypothetical protein
LPGARLSQEKCDFLLALFVDIHLLVRISFDVEEAMIPVNVYRALLILFLAECGCLGCVAKEPKPPAGPTSATVCELRSHPEKYLEKTVRVHGRIDGNGMDITIIMDLHCPKVGLELVGYGAVARTPNAMKMSKVLYQNSWIKPEQRHRLDGTVIGTFGMREGHLTRHLCIEVTSMPELTEAGSGPSLAIQR